MINNSNGHEFQIDQHLNRGTRNLSGKQKYISNKIINFYEEYSILLWKFVNLFNKQLNLLKKRKILV